jgi:hypothetical protein
MGKSPVDVATAKKSRAQAAKKAEIEAHSPKNRPTRRPLSSMYRLDIPPGIKEEGYTYRYILDRAERVEMFRGAWWEQVIDPTTKQPFRKASGGGEYLLLYKTKTEWFLEDQIENRKKPINLLADSARLKRNADSHEYVPEGHDAVVKIQN